MSDYVIMPKADYQNACDFIRTKSGKADLITSGQLKSEIEAIAGTGGSVEGVHFVTFMSEDGTEELYKRPVADGDDCADPVTRNLISAPTKASTAQYNYDHAGWATEPNGALNANALKAVTEDRTVYANFAAILRSYTITYLDADGSVLKTEILAYGATPSYTPEKDGCSFDGWSPALATVTGAASYTAKWLEKITFAGGTWADIARVCEEGNAQDYFAVGDTKTITVGDDDITIAVAGFDHDDLADGSGKAAMSVICMTVPNWTCYWNYSSMGNYKDSSFRFYMQTDSNTFIDNSLFLKLPADLRSVIKKVKKKYATANSSGSTATAYAEDNIWLPSLDELGGYSSLTNADMKPLALGQKYDLFPQLTSSNYSYASPTVTIGTTGTKVNYTTRSSIRGGSWNFAGISASGGTTDFGTASTQRYARFGFCI